MKWNFKKYFYILLASQLAVFLVMLAVTYLRLGSFSDQSVIILQEESYQAMEKELQTRVNLIITSIESEMRQVETQLEQLASVTSDRISAAFARGGMSAVNAFIDEWLPEIHTMLYGHAIEVFFCDAKTGQIIRHLGFGERQNLSALFTPESFATNAKTAAVCQTLQFGTTTVYVCSNQTIINAVVKNYAYDVVHAAHYGGNAYSWVNEVLNYDGGDDYAVRIIHPNLKDTEGNLLSTDLEDAVGNFPYQQELKGIRERGEVFHRYFFESIDGSGPKEKLSYAKLYKPFNWIIATGEDLETIDVHANHLTGVNKSLLQTMLWQTIQVLLIVLVIGSAIIFIIHRISQKHIDEFIEGEVSFDDLTGLYNRKYFYDAAEEMIAEYKDKGGVSIIRINLCNFKVVNDLYGMDKGDQLLCHVAGELKKDAQRFKFIAARFSADNFYICVPQKYYDQLPLVRQASVPWLNMSLSFLYGVYIVEEDTNVTVPQMCDRANLAISAGKTGTGTFIHCYKEEFRQQILKEKEIEGEMEQALAAGQFVIYIQPKYAVHSDQVVGGEALVRWQHPQKGVVSPADFIPLFERNGFIRDLDYYVWESCCAFIRCARDKGLSVPPISINVSRIHFYGKELQSKLEELLERYQLEPKDIELEVTETICTTDSQVFLEICSNLCKAGFTIAMDDFGSGYSSLNMLKEIPIDVIKMDMRFLAGDHDPSQQEKGRSILRSLIKMAQRLHLDIVVEGVETRDQVEFIKDIGQCAAQGYFYARPLPTTDFEAILRSVKTA